MARPAASAKAPLSVLDKALRLLGARARTEVELDRALTRAGYAAEERKSALARVKELGYMDDRELAAVCARSLTGKGDAPRLVEKKLQSQGVKAADARAAAAEAAQGLSADELAVQALQRKLRGRKPKDQRERLKLFRGLVSKGHRPSSAARALSLELDGHDDVEE